MLTGLEFPDPWSGNATVAEFRRYCHYDSGRVLDRALANAFAQNSLVELLPPGSAGAGLRSLGRQSMRKSIILVASRPV